MNNHTVAVQNCQKIFTEWEFTDYRELLDWLASHYKNSLTTKGEKEVISILGDKRDSRPLLLGDTLVFTTLHKSL